jgi:ferredoxin, 2Fe-2S
MPKITYVEHSGAERIIEVPSGWSVMEGAVLNAVPGIDADCGGNCACGTCHVYVDCGWTERLPPKQAPESSMLALAAGVRSESRLACQIKVTDDLDGLVVRTPPSQR